MTEQPAREIEAKYNITSPSAAKRMLAAAEVSAGFAADTAQTATDLDVYFDTRRFDLLRRGIALRVRMRGDVVLVTVKGLSTHGGSSVRDRLELQSEVTLSAGSAPFLEQTSPALQRAVREANPAKKKLRPVLTLDQSRTTRNVYPRPMDDISPVGTPANALAELSVDSVCVLRQPPRSDEADASVVLATFYDLELELLPGGKYDEFEVLVTRFDGRQGLRAAASSKLEAGLRAWAVAFGEGVGSHIQPDMHMAEACRLIWRQQAIEMILQEHGVRAAVTGDDDPEYVHDMRVAIRRARTAYELFGHYFRRKDVEPVIDGLRNLGRRLGKVRDLDVALENLRNAKQSLDDDDPALMEELERITLEQRDAAQKALLNWLDSKEHAAVIEDFMELASTPDMAVRRSLADAFMTQPIQVRHCMPSIILDRFERVRAYEALLASADDASPDQLHALRIQCKYLRYVLEFNRRLLGEEGETIIDSLKNMQDHLGELNDCAVELQRLSKLTKRTDMKAFAQQHMQTVAARRDELRVTLPPKFADFIRKENRRLLGEAIANI